MVSSLLLTHQHRLLTRVRRHLRFQYRLLQRPAQPLARRPLHRASPAHYQLAAIRSIHRASQRQICPPTCAMHSVLTPSPGAKFHRWNHQSRCVCSHDTLYDTWPAAHVGHAGGATNRDRSIARRCAASRSAVWPVTLTSEARPVVSEGPRPIRDSRARAASCVVVSSTRAGYGASERVKGTTHPK